MSSLLLSMWVGSLYSEPGGPNKGPGREIKVLGKDPTPPVTWEKLLVGGGGPGVFIFFAGDPGEEAAAMT